MGFMDKLKSFFGADDRDHQVQGHGGAEHDHDHGHDHDHAHDHAHEATPAPVLPVADPAGMPTGQAEPHEDEDRPA